MSAFEIAADGDDADEAKRPENESAQHADDR
jgi:hypothetical protein